MVPRTVDLRQIEGPGILASRIDRGLSHLLAEQERILAFGGWGGDQYGRWIAAVAMTYYQSNRDDCRVNEVFERFLDTQGANGMFGEKLDGMVWWGAGRALIGLYEYWELTRDARALDSAKALADFYLTDYPFDDAGTNHQQAVEGVVALWRSTRDDRYLAFADRLFHTLDLDFGMPSGGSHNQHTHGYLCILCGGVDLYEATGNDDYLSTTKRIWDDVLCHNMWVTGGISEMSAYEYEHLDEGCSIADWVRLCYRLWQVTRDPKYMDVAEHVLLNHLYFDQDRDGGFYGWRTLKEEPTEKRETIAWWCCSMHGQRVLLETLKYIFTHDDAGVDVNLYADAEARIAVGDGDAISLRQTVEYPTLARLEVTPKAPTSLALRLRIPQWTPSFRVTVNGAPIEGHEEAGRVTLERAWRAGDVVEIAFSPVVRIAPEGSNTFNAEPISTCSDGTRVERGAILYGPHVVMIDRELDADLPEAGRFEVLVPIREGKPFLEPADEDLPGRGPHALPGTLFQALGRELAAEDAPEAPLRRIHLVPTAETTDRSGHTPETYKLRSDVRCVSEVAYRRLKADASP